MALSDSRAITVRIAGWGIAILGLEGIALLLLPAFGLGVLVAVVAALISITLAGTFLVLMCFPWHRSPAALWLGAAWIVPLFIVLGIFVSAWVPIVVALPAIVVICISIAERRSERAMLSTCPFCTYDLTGLRRGTLCPECGRGRA
jgi:hypothetical protein